MVARRSAFVNVVYVIAVLSAAALPMQTAAAQVAVTPDNAKLSVPTNATGRNDAFFTLTNNASTAKTYYVTCTRTGAVASCSVNGTYPNVPSHASIPIQPTFSTGAPGTGTLQLKACDNQACAGGFWDTGSFNIAVQDFKVAVTPDASTGAFEPTRRASTGGYTAVFTVRNAGVITDSYSLTCTPSGGVTCGTVSPSTLTNLTPTNSATVTVSNYSVGAAGTGTLTLTATGSYSSDAGSYTVPVAAAGGPLVDFTPYNFATQDYGLCALNCFAAVYEQSTIPYVSFDIPHNVTLVYNGDRVNPRPFVHVNVTPDTGNTPTEYRLQVKVNGTLVSFENGDQTLRFAYPGRSTVRIGGQFDAAANNAATTNAYALDILVTAYYPPPQSPITTTLSTKLVVVNETNSPVAGGWTLSGIQRLYPQGDGSVLITEGEGSAVYFPNVGGSLITPPGQFSGVAPSTFSGTTWARIYPDGRRALFDNAGRMVQLRDRFNNTTTVVYDGSGRVSQIKDPANLALTLGYGTNGLATIQDPGTPVRTTSLNVDASRNLTAITDPDNVSTSFVFDATLQLSKVINRRGDTTTFTYDALSRKLALATAPPVPVFGAGTISPTASQAPWQHVGVPYSSTATTLAPSPVADTVRARSTDARGYVTVLQVDRFGAVTRIDDALSQSTRITRDGDSRVVRDSSPSGHVTSASWSGPNQTQSWDSTTQRMVNYTYEPLNNDLATVSGDADSVWNYWSGGHLDSTIVGARAAGNPLRAKSTFAYDARGRVVTATDPQSHSVTTYYHPDSWQNTDSVKANVRRTAYRYDGYGRVDTVKTPDNRVTTTQYDAMNRQTKTIGPILDTTIFSHDSVFLRQVRDANGQTYQFGYNALGWVVSRTDPAGVQDQYQYDQNGNVRQLINRRNQTIGWDAYDPLNRATIVTAAEGAKTKFIYDPQGRFLVDSNAASIDTIKVDELGRPTGEISVRAGTRYELRSHFTVRDLRDTIQSVAPWSSTISYHYYASSLLETLTDLAGGNTGLSYNADRQVTSAGLPTGLGIIYGNISTHTPGSLTYSDPNVNSTLGMYYQYDTLPKLAERDEANGIRGRDFRYDALKRLSHFGDYTWQTLGSNCHWIVDPGFGAKYVCDTFTPTKMYADSANFSYDSVGNRRDLGAVTVVGNMLVKFNGDSLVYDTEGNLIQHRNGAGQDVQRLWWNSLGQLIAVWTSGKDSVTFAYDGMGRRVSKKNATGTTWYVYDGDEMFAEVDSATGNRLAEYTYYPSIDRPHSVRVGGPTGSVYYYTQDHPGNVTGLINGSNTVSNWYLYQPFGADNGGSAPIANSLKFAARPQDPETGLYYMRARYYDPWAGRFISQDPNGLDGGINPYAYAGDDPANNMDPLGLDCWKAYTVEWTEVCIMNPDGTSNCSTSYSKSDVATECNGVDPNLYGGLGLGGLLPIPAPTVWYPGAMPPKPYQPAPGQGDQQKQPSWGQCVENGYGMAAGAAATVGAAVYGAGQLFVKVGEGFLADARTLLPRNPFIARGSAVVLNMALRAKGLTVKGGAKFVAGVGRLALAGFGAYTITAATLCAFDRSYYSYSE